MYVKEALSSSIVYFRVETQRICEAAIYVASAKEVAKCMGLGAKH
jgi:hypothetical protein